MQTSSGERYQGWVRNFRETWGFINAEGFQGDLFVGLKSNAHLPSLNKDDIVEFEVRTDDKGKPEAINVMVVGSQAAAGAGAAAVMAAMTAPAQLPSNGATIPSSPAARAEVDHLIGHTLVGRIKSFRDTWGFINSDSFTGDIFVHKKSNAQLGQLGSGDPVQFEIARDESNASGGCHAINVQVLKEELSTLVGQTVTGWVKSFKDSWGLLNSSRFDGDVFFGMKANKQLIGANLTAGVAVEFTVAPDDKGAKGVQALSVKVVGGGGAGAALGGGGAAMTGAMQMLLANGMAGANPLAAANGGVLGMMGMKPEALLGCRIEGVIRSFKDDWGFIISSAFEGDLFVHKGSNPNLANFQAGDQISFEIAQQNSGKCHAINVLPATGMNPGVAGGAGMIARATSLATLEGQRVQGQVRSFDGNWGFATSGNFPGDIFIGSRSNPHLGPLNPGDTIEFTVARNSSGKSQTGYEALQVQQVVGTGSGLATMGAMMGNMMGNTMGNTAMGNVAMGNIGLINAAMGNAAMGNAAMGTAAMGNAAMGNAVLGGGLTGNAATFNAAAMMGTGAAGMMGSAAAGIARSRSPRGGIGRAVTDPSRQPSAMTGVALTGVIRSFRGDWGFVNSESFDGDVFVGSRSNPHLAGAGLNAGDQVMFSISVGAGGKAEAVDVQVLVSNAGLAAA